MLENRVEEPDKAAQLDISNAWARVDIVWPGQVLLYSDSQLGPSLLVDFSEFSPYLNHLPYNSLVRLQGEIARVRRLYCELIESNLEKSLAALVEEFVLEPRQALLDLANLSYMVEDALGRLRV